MILQKSDLRNGHQREILHYYHLEMIRWSESRCWIPAQWPHATSLQTKIPQGWGSQHATSQPIDAEMTPENSAALYHVIYLDSPGFLVTCMSTSLVWPMVVLSDADWSIGWDLSLTYLKLFLPSSENEPLDGTTRNSHPQPQRSTSSCCFCLTFKANTDFVQKSRLQTRPVVWSLAIRFI